MDPLLVITNGDAGTADEERSSAPSRAARARLGRGRRRPPTRASSTACCTAPARGGSWWPAATAACTPWSRRCTAATSSSDAVVGLLPLGTGNDFARALRHPARHRGGGPGRRSTARSGRMDLIVDELGEVVVNNVHVGAGAQASRAGRDGRTGSARVGVGKVNLGKLGYPIGAALAAFKPPFVRLRVEVDGEVVTDLDQPVLMVAVGNGAHVGGGTELTPDADPEDGKVDVMVSRAIGPPAELGYASQLAPRRAPRARRRARTCAAAGDGLRRGVLDQRRRRDLRPRAAPHLARRARGVLLRPAPN